MIDDIDRRTLMGADKEDAGDRRQPLFWLLWALLIFFVLFGCGQTAMWFDSGGLEDVEVRSGLTVNYGIWTPVAFGGINPLIIAEAAGDNGGVVFLASVPSDSCFLLGDCTPNPPTPSPTPGPSATPTVTSTNTSTPTNTPTPTSTFFPTYTFTPTDTPTITPTPTNTPTPTPQVYPIKLANPGNIPPGPTTLQFSIIVINYGSIPPAHLTAVIDRLPPGMSYNSGCNPACGASPGDTTITWNVDEWIPQSGFSRFRFIANANGIAGEVFQNEVETQGGNFETSVNVKRVYVYTPTPTSTPVSTPVANDDPTGAPVTTYITNEDTPLSISAPGLLANDTDAPWDTLYAFPLGPPSNGVAVINLDGSFTYTPNANFFGSDTFTYEACDNPVPANGLCDSATVYITINTVEDIPVALDDSYSVDEDNVLNVPAGTGVLSNDTDGDGDLLRAANPSVPSDGSLILNDDGSFTYSPDADSFGSDQFTYEACDPDLDCDPATVDITIISVNDPPVAIDDPTPLGVPPFPRFNTDEDIPIDIDVLANDYEDPVEGDTISISGIPFGPSNGSTFIDNNLTPFDPTDDFITYTPALHYYGDDNFTYRITDGNGGFDDAVVRITVDPINDAPTAVDDNGTMGAFDPPLVVDVLANDADLIEGEPLAIISVQSTIPPGGVQTTTDQGGLASINDNGTPGNTTDDYIEYDPQGYSHPTIPDTFTYTISDGQPINDTDTATVSIIVNDAPVAEGDSALTLEDNPVAIDVLTNDALLEPNGDTVELIAGSVTNPANGTVSVNDAGTPLDRSDDFIDYTPNLNYFGGDTFTYQITDTGLNSNIATVTVTVTSVNDQPIGVDDDFRTNRNTPANFDVLFNDTDVDLDVLEVSDITNASDGTVTNNTTDVTYDPNMWYVGNDSFTYQVCDTGTPVECDPIYRTVSVVVSGPPVANGIDGLQDAYVTPEDTPLIVSIASGVLNNDFDPNPLDIITATEQVTTASGGLVLNPNGSFTYSPNLNFNGNDQFTYDVCDPGGLCDSAVVNITVVADNDAPIANNDPDGAPLNPPFSFFTDEDSPILINVTANDTDVDGTIDNSSVVIASSPSSGSVINHLDGTVTYTPNADYLAVGGPNLNIWFSYTVDDNDGDTSSPGWVYVAITPINDPPVAVDDDRETGQDVDLTISVLSNDYDVDTGDVISIFSFDLVGSQGATISQSGNRLVYDPDSTFSHPTILETFTYTIEDLQNDTGGPATVSVIVNDAPVAFDDSVVTPEDTPIAIDVLDNDTDINGHAIEILGGSVSSPSIGVASVNDNGSPGDRTDDYIDYTPNPDVFGFDTFTYIVTDTGLDSNVATVTIDVTSVNDPPIALDDNERTNVNTPGTFDILGNDSDIDSGTLSVLTVTDGSWGTVANNSSDVTYTPNAGYVGPDIFSYTVTDGDGGSDSANVNVVVNGPPVADVESYNTQEDTPFTISAPGVLDGDIDPNSDPLTTSVVSTTSSGTLNLNGNGSFDYNPNAHFNGTDQFTYEACDPGSPGQPQLCDNATVTINISALPDPPVASDDAFSVNEDEPLNVASPGVLSNDDDPDNLTGNPWDGLTITLVPSSGPTNANSFTLNGDGSFDYVPLPDYHGSDSFQYEACDPTSRCDTAIVNITVNSINDPPIAVDDPTPPGGPFSTDEDSPLTIDVLGNDYEDPIEGDTLSVGRILIQGTYGNVVNNGSNVTYNPNLNYLAEGEIQLDTFTYTLSDGNGGTDTATVTIEITGMNDAPNAVDDVVSFTLSQFFGPHEIFVLGNDSDIDIGDTILVSSCDNPSPSLGASVDCSSQSSIIYTPNTALGGSDPLNPDTFDYLISDSIGATDSATVSILVNDPPDAVDDDDPGVPYTVLEDGVLSTGAPGVLENDSDPNGDPLYPSVISSTTNGSLSLNGDGSFTYNPIDNFFGNDQFTYEICDAPGGAGYCASATAYIAINSVNDPPVAGNDSEPPVDQVTASTTGIIINVVANDSDLEGAVDPTTVVIDSPPAHGTAVSNGDGTITYTLTDGHFLSDSFTYTVDDDQSPAETSNAATVSIQIIQPVLTIEKGAVPAEATQGSTVDFFIIVRNLGTGVVYDVHLQDTLGSCFQWVSGNPGGPIGDLLDGEERLIHGAATVEKITDCSNVNSASVSSDNAISANTSTQVTLLPSGGGSSAMLPASLSVASTGSSTEAAIAFLIPVAMLVTPFILSWWGKVKRTPRQR